jgi:dienelactone hydrolase
VKEMHMNTPEWLKPGLQGAAVGAVALAIVGFSWGGWVTGGTAKQMASDQARLEVVAALVPICLEQSSQDPQVVATLARLKDTSSYQRSDLLIKAGWAHPARNRRWPSE